MKFDHQNISKTLFWIAAGFACLYFAWALRPHTQKFDIEDHPFHASVTRMSDGLDSCWLVVWEHEDEEKGHGDGHGRPVFLVKCDDQ